MRLNGHCERISSGIFTDGLLSSSYPPHCRQPFAQARELQAVRDRVSRLETLLLQIAPEQFKAIVGQVGQHSDLGVDSPSGGYNDSFGRGTPGSPHAGLPRVKRSESEMDMEDENEIGGDEEQAAIALESFAVGRGNPMVRASHLLQTGHPLY